MNYFSVIETTSHTSFLFILFAQLVVYSCIPISILSRLLVIIFLSHVLCQDVLKLVLDSSNETEKLLHKTSRQCSEHPQSTRLLSVPAQHFAKHTDTLVKYGKGVSGFAGLLVSHVHLNFSIYLLEFALNFVPMRVANKIAVSSQMIESYGCKMQMLRQITFYLSFYNWLLAIQLGMSMVMSLANLFIDIFSIRVSVCQLPFRVHSRRHVLVLMSGAL